MLGTLRNWLSIRSAMKGEARLRASRSVLNAVVVEDRLKHVEEMLRAGQREYAEATLQEILDNYPNEAVDQSLTVLVLIEMNRLDQAEDIVRRAMDRNPDNQFFMELHAFVADKRGDTPERLARWRAFRRRYPAYGRAFTGEARALQAAGQGEEAERVLAEGARRVTDDEDLIAEYARAAEARGDWEQAIVRWTLLRDRHETSHAEVPIARAIRAAGRPEEADAALLESRRRFPLEVAVLEELALQRQHRGDYAGAAEAWQDVRTAFPHMARGYLDGAFVLRQLGREADADTLITQAAERQPDNIGLQIEYAMLADRRSDIRERIARWSVVRRRFPGNPAGYLNEATAIAQAGRLDEAVAMLDIALVQFPRDADVLRRRAELADQQGDAPAALGFWRAAAAARPDGGVQAALARALAQAGDAEGAVAAISEAVRLMPYDPVIAAQHATLTGQPAPASALAAPGAADIEPGAAAIEPGAAALVEPGAPAVEPDAAPADAGAAPTPREICDHAAALREQGRAPDARAALEAGARQFPDDADLQHDLGQMAMQEGRWADAEAIWRPFADRFGHAWAHLFLVRAIRAQGREAEADTALAHAHSLHPADHEVTRAAADRAFALQDWPSAHRLWSAVAEHAPDDPTPCFLAAIALRETGDTDAARRAMEAGAARFPHAANFVQCLAEFALDRGEYDTAEQLWRRHNELAPDAWWGPLGLAGAIRGQGRAAEAEALLEQGAAQFPDHALYLHQLADAARARGDWDAAERHARRIMERHPDDWVGLWSLAAVARAQGRTDEAAALLLEGVGRHPNIHAFVHDLARLAEARQDWPDVELWWRRHLELTPHIWWMRLLLAQALIRQGRVAEAEQHLRTLQADHPAEPEPFALHARLAQDEGNWAEADARWTVLRARFPDDVRGWTEGAHVLREAGEAERGAALLAEAAARLPHEARPKQDLARLASWRGEWEAAAPLWRDALACDASSAISILGLIEAECHLGEIPAALARTEAFVAQPDRSIGDIALAARLALRHAPDPLPPWLTALEDRFAAAVADGADAPVGWSVWLAYAEAAKRVQDFGRYLERMEAAARALPDEAVIRHHLFEARELALPGDPDAAAAADAADAADATDTAAGSGTGGLLDAEIPLLRRFESLGGGGGGGCEFGFHQRHFGFEPLSLLRWSSIEPEALCDLLECRCEGVGNPEALLLEEQAHPDWRATDRTYGIQMDHTHLDRRTVPVDLARRIVSRSFTFLARKLLADLKAGEKAFVYRMSGAMIPDDTIARLHRAIAAYGPGRLVIVMEGAHAAEPFDLLRPAPHCLVVVRDDLRAKWGDAEPARIASWQAVCRAAAEAFDLTA